MTRFVFDYFLSSIVLSDANINLQMNYWSALTTNLNVTKSLFDYMEVCTLSWSSMSSEQSIHKRILGLAEHLGAEGLLYCQCAIQHLKRVGYTRRGPLRFSSLTV